MLGRRRPQPASSQLVTHAQAKCTCITRWTIQSSAYVPLWLQGRRSKRGSRATLPFQVRWGERSLLMRSKHPFEVIPQCNAILATQLLQFREHAVGDAGDACEAERRRGKEDVCVYVCVCVGGG